MQQIVDRKILVIPAVARDRIPPNIRKVLKKFLQEIVDRKILVTPVVAREGILTKLLQKNPPSLALVLKSATSGYPIVY